MTISSNFEIETKSKLSDLSLGSTCECEEKLTETFPARTDM